jgi:hypothetical protein
MLTELLIGGATYFISKKLTEKALEGSNDLLSKANQLIEHYDAEQYEEAIELAEEILEKEGEVKLDEEVYQLVKWYYACSYSYGADQLINSDYSWTDDENGNAYNMLMKGRDLFFDYGNEYGWDDDVVYQIMLIDNQRGWVVTPRDFAIYLIGSENDDYRKKAIDIYNEDTDFLLHSAPDRFTEISYDERKYVYIGKNINKIGGTYQLIDDKRLIDWIFTLDQLPSDMVFPLGRPQSGLYMAHPVKTDHYYPMKGVKETLFMEKVREFCWLVQCLGATEVSFHSNKGLSVSEGMNSSMNVEVQAGLKSNIAGGSNSNTKNSNKTYKANQQVELVQNFAPKKKAYCPDDLIWLDSDPAWQMLLKQRLEGGIMEYTYKISSSETCQMSTNEMESVKANFEYMMVKANGSYDASTDKTFSSNEETEWSIHVEFAPLEELTEEPKKTKSDNSQNETTMNDYEKMDGSLSLTKEEVKEYVARIDNPFSMEIKDVWELENYPQKPMALGRVWSGTINKDDEVVIVINGDKIEATVFGVYIFGKIRDYAEASDACGILLQGVDADDLQVGAVIYKQSEYAESNGQTHITASEQEYLDMVKDCLEDGEIGVRERKLLDKIRVKNGISEERAKELEATLSAPQLTDDEKEYLEAFKDACEDGKVSDKQRRLLEKLRVMYGISEERAMLLENI